MDEGVNTIDEIFENQAELKSDLRKLYDDGVLDDYYHRLLHYDINIGDFQDLLEIAKDIQSIDEEMSPYFVDPIIHTFREDDLAQASGRLRDLEDVLYEKKDIIIESIDAIGDELYEDKENGDTFSRHSKTAVSQYQLVLNTLGDLEGEKRLSDICSGKKEKSPHSSQRKNKYEELVRDLEEVEYRLEDTASMETAQQQREYRSLLRDLQDIYGGLKKTQHYADADKVKNIINYVKNLQQENKPYYKAEKSRKTLLILSATGLMLTAFSCWQMPHLASYVVDKSIGHKLDKIVENTNQVVMEYEVETRGRGNIVEQEVLLEVKTPKETSRRYPDWAYKEPISVDPENCLHLPYTGLDPINNARDVFAQHGYKLNSLNLTIYCAANEELGYELLENPELGKIERDYTLLFPFPMEKE